MELNKDIHIRRISKRDGCSNKVAVHVFEFLNQEIKKKNLQTVLGEIDYVAVIDNTKLKQEDYVSFLAFKNREVHGLFVDNFNRPLKYAGREMLFEINKKETSIKLQKINRNRFNENQNSFGQDQDHQTDKQSSDRYFKRLMVEENGDEDYLENADDEPKPKKQKQSTTLDILNSKIPQFLESIRTTTVKKQVEKTED